LKLIRTNPYAKLTSRADTLLYKAAKIEAKWKHHEKRWMKRFEQGYTGMPTIEMDRLMRILKSIKDELGELGFGLK